MAEADTRSPPARSEWGEGVASDRDPHQPAMMTEKSFAGPTQEMNHVGRPD
jgi:hypothetical protein